MCILDLNKVLMYELHYNYIKNKYGISSRLFFTDTNRLMYQIKIEDVYEDFRKNKEIIEFCNHSVNVIIQQNIILIQKSVVGKMKDGTGGVAIKEFVALKPKMYSFLVDHSIEQKRLRIKLLQQ